MAERVNGWFPRFTTSKKGRLVEPPLPSLTVTVINVVPNWFVTDVTSRARLAPLPPKTMLAFGTRVVLEEVAATVSRFAGVLESPTVKASGPATVSSLIDWLPNPERVGGELPVARK